MKINRDKITIGTDPEVFLVDSITGNPVSAIGLIGGSKDSPRPLSELGHFVQEDNVLVEFNIPPCLDAASIHREIQKSLELINEIIPDGTSLSIVSSMHFSKKQLNNPKAKQFGCDKDYNAWTYEENDFPNTNTTLRTAGGHIHVGCGKIDEDTTVSLIRAMDLFLGVPSILMDTDKERRILYGKAGSFRFKPYGIEYRTLSNFWIKDEENIQWMVSNLFKAIDFVNLKKGISEEDSISITSCINNSDEKLALELINKYNLTFLQSKNKILV